MESIDTEFTESSDSSLPSLDCPPSDTPHCCANQLEYQRDFGDLSPLLQSMPEPTTVEPMTTPTFQGGLDEFGSERERPSSTLPVSAQHERVIDPVDNSVLIQVTYRHCHAAFMDEHHLFLFCAFSTAGVMHRRRRGLGVTRLANDPLFNQLISAVVGCAVECVLVVEDDMCNLHEVEIVPVGDRSCYRYITVA